MRLRNILSIIVIGRRWMLTCDVVECKIKQKFPREKPNSIPGFRNNCIGTVRKKLTTTTLKLDKLSLKIPTITFNLSLSKYLLYISFEGR